MTYKTVEDLISEDDIARVAIVVMNRFDSMMGEPAKDGSNQLVFYPIGGGRRQRTTRIMMVVYGGIAVIMVVVVIIVVVALLFVVVLLLLLWLLLLWCVLFPLFKGTI